MRFLSRFLDKNVVSMLGIGTFSACAILTSGLDNYTFISPLFSVAASSVLGYYGWSTINSLMEKSTFYYKRLFSKKSVGDQVCILQEFGNEDTYKTAADFFVKTAVGANVFVNCVKAILANDEKAFMAADTITPVASATVIAGITFFQSRIDSLRDYEEKLNNNSAVSRRETEMIVIKSNFSNADDKSSEILEEDVIRRDNSESSGSKSVVVDQHEIEAQNSISNKF